MSKTCNTCLKALPAEAFREDRRAVDNLAITCEDCRIAKASMVNALFIHADERYIAQGMRCAICNCKAYLDRMVVDEDGGLLCKRCNRILRQVQRNPRILSGAVEYLEGGK